MKPNAFTLRWRPALIALSALLVLAIVFAIAPAREAAADFLGLFRVRKFAVIPLDQQQLERLGQLADSAGNAFSEPEILRAEGPEQAVSDAAQASAMAGFLVRSPAQLPEAASRTNFMVQAGPALRFAIDRAALEVALQAAGASATGLPQTEKIVFDVDVATAVVQEFRSGRVTLDFIQVPSPNVNLPEGIDATALAETGFLFLGLPADEARRMASSIDWTSTLAVPVPADMSRAREVTVDGVTGLLLESLDTRRGDSALLWEKDGILYFMNGQYVDATVLLTAADSLQ